MTTPRLQHAHLSGVCALLLYIFDTWVVSHWESGLTIGESSGVRGDTPREAAELAVPFLRKKGIELIKAKLAEKGFTQ